MPFPSYRRLTAFAALSGALAVLHPAHAATASFAAAAQPDGSGNLVLRWPSVAGQRYIVESSTDLAAWMPLPGEIVGDGAGLATTVVPAGATTPSRLFWRVTTLAETGAPIIHLQPQNQTVAEGLPATFRVTVSGAGPFRFVWSRNGEPLGNADTSWYVTPVTTPSDNGAHFSVTVTGPAGHTTSLAATLTVSPAPVGATPQIDTAPRSGVSGYPIAIFGVRFGATAGTLRIHGVAATITRWSDGVIEAVVPPVAAGEGELTVATAAGVARSPFTAYAIDPRFLLKPTALENLLPGRPVVIDATYEEWAYSPNPPATTFLADNTADGTARIFLSPTPTIAMDLGRTVTGPVFFSFHGGGSWYDDEDDVPRAYSIEASTNSTDGRNGQWATVAAITDNSRRNRTHPLTLNGARWLRWRINAAVNSPVIHLKELRVFRATGPAGPGGLDAFSLLGDSNTANDFGRNTSDSLWTYLRTRRGDGTEPLTCVMGMSGQNTGVLSDTFATNPRSLANAMRLEPQTRFLGLAVGINDARSGSWMVDICHENFEQGIRQILAAGKVPILARIPETKDDPDGWGYPADKKRMLAYIDELAAKYRMIPGPDAYTFFRLHPEMRSDAVHHDEEGGANNNRLWAEALLRSGIYGAPAP